MAQLHKQREEKKTTAQAEAARQRSRELRGKLKALKEEQNLREKILAPEEVGAVEITVEQEQEAQTRLEQIREEAKNLREAFRMANRRLLAASKEKMETLLSQLSELAANPAVERSDKAYQTAEDMLAHAERAYHEADERLNKPRVEPVAGEIKTGFFGKLKSFFMGGAKPGEETPEPKIREIETSFFELDEEMEAPQQLKDIERRATSLNEQLAKGLMRIDQADKALQQLQAEWEPFTKKSIAGKEEFFAAYKAMTNLQETMEKMRKEAGETKKTATRRKVA
jgi:chromosome segregation ATPase